jgi:chorismate mutase/prephenate dehydratase
MASKKGSKKGTSPSAAARGGSIPALRVKIDAIDQKLVKLMNERAGHALEIGKLKTTSGISAYAPAREDAILGRVADLNQGPLAERSVRAVFRELISGSRSLEKNLRIAYLGPAYSYSHLAAISRFGQSVELVPVGTIAGVFEEITRRQADFGVVPIENSTDGRVADTLDMFTRIPARVCGEVQLRIHHNLLGKCARAEVVEVYSKPQALSQCRNWLARHLPGARLVEVASTVAAAQTAKTRPEIAAIAGAQAGAFYGLDVLAENIEDNAANVTRFFIIGEASAPKTGKDKMSAMFEVPHKPGALADAMNVFKNAKLNLTWIESFPIARPEGGYMFFIELDGHETDAAVGKAMKALEKKTLQLEVLGSYARSEPVG